MIFLTIYLVVGLLVAALIANEVSFKLGIICGFLWPVAYLIMLWAGSK